MKREAFLARVRQALHRREGAAAEVPPALRPVHEAWDERALAEGFLREVELAGGRAYRATDVAEARGQLEALLKEVASPRVACSDERLVTAVVAGLEHDPSEPAAASVGVTGVRFALADTGTLVVTSDAGRLASLLPRVHVALVGLAQLRPSMAEALAGVDELPSAWVQITGPSRSADIEGTLTVGVHGPARLVVVLIENAEA